MKEIFEYISAFRIDLIFVFLLCFFAITGFIFILLRERGADSDFKILSDGMKKIKSGDYKIRLSNSKNKNEAFESFDEMAKKLEQEADENYRRLAEAAHDMKTPLTTIRGFADAILDGQVEKEEASRALILIREDILRLSEMIDGLLCDSNPLRAGNIKEMKPFNICESARRVLLMFENQIEDKKLEVVFSSDADDMYATGYEADIYRVMYNLCENAVKFSSPGGLLEINISREDRATKSKTRFSIYNEGCGVPKDDIERIFERNYRAKNSQEQGNGLGLYISSSIVSAHGGTLKVESEEGKFCRFFFDISSAEKPTHKNNKQKEN